VDLIYFVPYDQLHYLPLHALLLNREPLIKNYQVVYTSGASLLQFSRSNNDYLLRKCTAYGVALGNDEKEFLEEAEKVANIFGTKPAIDVTKEQVLQSLSSDILHFSCHGYFNYEDPLSSGIVLKDNEILTAREIFSQKIKSKLVTLSACETGISENKPGDELIGLTRSLLYSGAQSVVVSLWSASSLATLKIMIEFYTNLRTGNNKATALQKAQLKIKQELGERYGNIGAHPFFWAPFILIGDWR